MQLTPMSWDFKLFILVLGIGYISVAWLAEKYVWLRVARGIGALRAKLRGVEKKRKLYKVVREKLRW